MVLTLNSPNEYTKIDGHKIPFHSEAYGNNAIQMQQLVANGRTPMSVAYLMQKRLDVRDIDDPEVKSAWTDNYFDTGDGVVYHPEGTETLVVLDSEHLRNMNSQSPRNGGALLFSTDRDEAFEIYEQLKKESNVEVFKKGKLGAINKGLSRQKAKSHPVWNLLARDKNLLNTFVDATFADYQERFAKGQDADNLKLMEIYPGSCNGDTPEMRAWCVYWLEGRSFADGGGYLDGGGGRLVGLAPEAQRNGSGVVKNYTIADLVAFDKAVRGLESTVRPELLKPFADLRKKL
jgi:hypothetical protein